MEGKIVARFMANELSMNDMVAKLTARNEKCGMDAQCLLDETSAIVASP
jgi:hypothetical protein